MKLSEINLEYFPKLSKLEKLNNFANFENKKIVNLYVLQIQNLLINKKKEEFLNSTSDRVDSDNNFKKQKTHRHKRMQMQTNMQIQIHTI